MKTREDYISSSSEYFVYLPSVAAKETFFYPVCTGNFVYKAGYYLRRASYDSFLLMYVRSGQLTVEYDDKKENVRAGSFVLLDCYKKHAYYSDTGWESIWCHFDGPVARSYFNLVIESAGHVFSLPNPYTVVQKLTEIYRVFANGEAIREAFLSRLLTDILTEILLAAPAGKVPVQAEIVNSSKVDAMHSANDWSEVQVSSMEGIISYIHEHFAEALTVNQLAKMAGLSQYYFIRLFKKTLSYTPHEYIINIRISTAKYLLTTTQLSVKEICFITGFSSESAFCTAFKKHTGLAPAEYRKI